MMGGPPRAALSPSTLPDSLQTRDILVTIIFTQKLTQESIIFLSIAENKQLSRFDLLNFNYINVKIVRVQSRTE
jgi:hypothetical protein